MVETKGFPPPPPPDLATLVDQESCQRLRCTRQVAGDPVVWGGGVTPEHHGAFTLVPTVLDPRRHDAGPLAAAGSGLDLHPDWCP